jgi:hypothetical protein
MLGLLAGACAIAGKQLTASKPTVETNRLRIPRPIFMSKFLRFTFWFTRIE